MSDDDEGIWSALKAYKKQKFDTDRKNFLAQANLEDDGGWTKHTEWHWSRMIGNERLDYWPSRKKFMWKKQVMRGLRAMRKVMKQGEVK
jgi:hypothetical protein